MHLAETKTMRYRENKTDGFLSNFVRCCWEFDNRLKDVNYTILPDGHFDIIFEIKNNTFSNVSMTGVWTKPVNVHIEKDTRLIGVRFKLLAAEYIFRQSLRNILNTKTGLPVNFFGARNLPFDDFDAFSGNFLEKISPGLKHLKEVDNRKFKLFELLYENKGTLKINVLAEKVCWSRRQINRYFNQKFGFSLKTFSNILRLCSSYRQIANGRLFPQQDYFDQAHFIKEVIKYTGATPKELYKNENDRFLQLSNLLTS